MNIAEAIIKNLENIGVKTVFGGSGQSDAELLFALDKTDIEVILIRHEQAASFMACGYGMFDSDNLGVCFSTAGPGVINMISGLAVAYSDSLPVLSITPYTPPEYRGRGDLGETSGYYRTPDSQKMLEATTKKSFILERPEDTCDILEEAINLAFAERPGPVNLHVGYNLMKEEVPNYRDIEIVRKPVLASTDELDEFAKALGKELKQDRDVIALLGYGCVRSGAEAELKDLLETYQIPFVTTMDGKGVLSEGHPLALGTIGVSGDQGAKKAFKDAEAVLAVGNSFAKWSAWKFAEGLFADKNLFHINIAEKELGKNYQPDYALQSDAKPAVEELLKRLSKEDIEVRDNKELPQDRYYNREINYQGDLIHPGELVLEISHNLPEDSIILGDAGGHMLWLHSYLNLTKGQNYHNPGSFGPMAFSVNGALGIKKACPERPVIVGCGDGGYQMSGFEFITAVENEIPVIWIIFNNGEFNVIKMFHLRFKETEVYNHFANPDFSEYAKVCGGRGYKIRKLADFAPAFKEALAAGEPAIIDVKVDPDVYPPFYLYDEEEE